MAWEEDSRLYCARAKQKNAYQRNTMGKKHQIEIEHVLRSRSRSIIWGLISTAEGMQRWIANEVTQDGDTLTFTWGKSWECHQVKSARVLLSDERDRRFRFRWEDDEEDVYVELRVERSALTGDYVLHITDFAEEDDADDMRELWDGDLQRLYRNTGV